MIPRNITLYLISFTIYIFLQVALLNKLVIANMAFCFFYVGFLIFLPINTSRIALLLSGFFIGMIIDIFGDTIGMHMIACTFLMFIQPFWQQATLGDIGEISGPINMKNISIYRLAVYALPMLVIHHLIIFLIDSIGAGVDYEIFFRVILSTFFTFFVLIVIQLFAMKTNQKL
ncbi:MAG: hypothetical protein WBA74_17250 [Cyclobacteriaceae bacterium]